MFVVERAEVPGAPSSPQLARALLLSFALGLGAGLGAAYVLERLDDTVTSAEEVERISGLAMLGTIPKIKGRKSVETELSDPRSALSEAYRSLCTALQFSTDSGLPKTLLVTSTGPAEGKSITAVAIARHFATMGLKVLVVDADLRNPSLHTRLGLDNAVGLSNYLTGAALRPKRFRQPHRESRLHGLRPAAAQRRRPLGKLAVVVAALGRFGGVRPHRARRSARHGTGRRAALIERRRRHRVRCWRRAGPQRPRAAR